MSSSVGAALNFARIHKSRFIKELGEFLRFPSISNAPHSSGMRQCAAWLAAQLRRIGLEHVRLLPTAGAPVVHACWYRLPQLPTVLIYGHYDVQPPEPLAEWRSPPFEPSIRHANLYGRGASDDKGQLFAHIKACEAWLAASRRLPVNVVALFEGEEETGSTHFRQVLQQHRRHLRADVAIVSDTQMLGPDRPAITCSLRGMLSTELRVMGPGRDLHSGSYGGAVHNPIQALSEILGRLHDADGRVAIPNFYDSVRDNESAACPSAASASSAALMRRSQAPATWGESGYTPHERTTIRPALTINGILGGYQGPGGKGVIPRAATAKLSFRLVPDQDPVHIERIFRNYLESIRPASVRTELRVLASSRPVSTPEGHPFLRAAMASYRSAFGATPVLLRSGGTIPVVNALREVLGIPTLLMGFALPDDGAHGPNEKLHLPTFFRGVETSIRFLQAVREAR